MLLILPRYILIAEEEKEEMNKWKIMATTQHVALQPIKLEYKILIESKFKCLKSNVYVAAFQTFELALFQ